jgi:hypothetical protein
MVLVAIVLGGCGGGPDDDQQAEAKQPPPAAEHTELRDAAKAPLERAEGVQQTLDERAAKMDAETRAAIDGAAPEEDPNAKKDDKDVQENEE